MAQAKARNQGYDVCIVGGGIAGLSAACQATRWGLSVLLLENMPLFGGQVATVGEIEGLVGAGVEPGAALASRLVDALRQAGGRIVEAEARAVEASGAVLRIAVDGEVYRARHVIAATGQRPRLLGLPGESEFLGSGVSHCATCDGPLMRGRDVVVVGGGDAALQDALVVAKFARNVTVVSRGRLRAKPTLVDRAVRCANLRFVWDSEVVRILGESGVEGVVLRDRAHGAPSELPCTGLFVRIGGVANSEWLPPELRDAAGQVRVGEDFSTDLPQLHAIGALRRGFSGELATAMGEAASVLRAIAA